MATDTIDHTTLMRLVEAGAVRSAHVIGQPGGWGVMVKYGMTERPLAAQRSREVRIFRKLETLVNYLKEIGIPRFDVDAVNFDPDTLKETRKRPDRAAAMRSAHEAAAHAKWLKDEIQASIDDPRPNLTHEDVMRQMDEKIKKITKARRASH